jgi:Co/Zn/Cd efflux system component
MIVTGIVTVYTRSGRPDLVVGLGIAVLNADAAREVWSEARKGHSTAEA